MARPATGKTQTHCPRRIPTLPPIGRANLPVCRHNLANQPSGKHGGAAGPPYRGQCQDMRPIVLGRTFRARRRGGQLYANSSSSKGLTVLNSRRAISNSQTGWFQMCVRPADGHRAPILPRPSFHDCPFRRAVNGTLADVIVKSSPHWGEVFK